MTAEILINATPRETRVAVVEDGVLQEVQIERGGDDGAGVVDNIYLATVARVLPGMQAAFVDIGLERNAFLHAHDLAGDNDTSNTPITALLQRGQRIIVQVIRAPISDKGARLTGQVSLASPNLVYLPTQPRDLSISRRIDDPAARSRLAAIVDEARERCDANDGGLILRTAASRADAAEIHADMEFLVHLWRRTLHQRDELIAAEAQGAPGTMRPVLLHRNPPLALRAVRDLVGREVEKVRVDSAETCRRVQDFVTEWMPDAAHRIEHYTAGPVFDLYGVEEEIHRALQKRVPLPSGGHLVFEQTEAMTTVDVNTGSFVGRTSLEATILQTNMEAAAEVARQLRVRNIGGIIIVDFIDMRRPPHRTQVMEALTHVLARDNAAWQASGISALGLVEIARKRTSESLERLLTESCPACNGLGVRKTAQFTCDEIFREILRAARQSRTDHGDQSTGKYLVAASGAMVDYLRKNESTGLADLGKFTGADIELQVDPDYRQEQFDVRLV